MNSNPVLLWVLGGLFGAFFLYILFDAWIVARKRRRQAEQLYGEEASQSAEFTAPPDNQWSDFRAATCAHCHKTLYVPKLRRFKPFRCPHCEALNPALCRDALAPLKKFLRWLLYPSFQDRF